MALQTETSSKIVIVIILPSQDFCLHASEIYRVSKHNDDLLHANMKALVRALCMMCGKVSAEFSKNGLIFLAETQQNFLLKSAFFVDSFGVVKNILDCKYPNK